VTGSYLLNGVVDNARDVTISALPDRSIANTCERRDSHPQTGHSDSSSRVVDGDSVSVRATHEGWRYVDRFMLSRFGWSGRWRLRL